MNIFINPGNTAPGSLYFYLTMCIIKVGNSIILWEIIANF